MKKIDTKKTIRFYDDTDSSIEPLYLDAILFEDKFTCLCSVSGLNAPLLFNKATGEVVSKSHAFWYAENYVTEAEKNKDKAFEFVQKKHNDSFGIKTLELDDVTRLVKILTNYELDLTEIIKT